MKVPQAQQQVNLAPLPQVRQTGAGASPEAFGGVAARQLGQLAQGIENAAGFLQQRQDQETADLVFRSQTSANDAWKAKQAEILNRQGQNAWGAAKEADAWFGEAQQKYGEALVGNARAQKIFNQEMAKLRTQGVDAANRHEIAQRDASLRESANASIISSIDLASSDPTNTAGVSAAKGEVLRRIDFIAASSGWAPERKQVEVENKLTALHTQVIKSMLDSNLSSQAEEYFKTNKGEIYGANRSTLEELVGKSTRLAKTQEAADATMALGDTEAAAIEHIRKNYSGEDEKEIVSEVKTRYAERRKAVQEGQSQAADQAWQYMTQNRRLPPLTMRQAMDGKQRAELEAAFKRQREGSEVETNLAVYQMLASDPAKIKTMPDNEFFALSNVLSKSDFKKFADMRADKATSKDNPGALDIGSVNSVLNVRLNSLGLNPSEKGDNKEGQRIAAIRKHVNDLVLEQQAQIGRKLNDAEITKLVDDQFLRNRQFRTSVIGISTGTQSQRLFDMKANDIPKSVQDAIKSDFAAAGIDNPTEADMLGAYYQLDLMQRRQRK